MGCFSFLCKRSGKAALSISYGGSPVHIFLLKDGEVMEHMHGNYNSYGRVFDGKGESFDWNIPWGDVCDLMFSGDSGDGIAVILDEYYDGKLPLTKSDDDPNQGWGDHEELMGSCSTQIFKQVKNPFHKIYKK